MIRLDGPERADNIFRPGRTAVIVVGWQNLALIFGANTADAGVVSFGLIVGRWSFEWTIGPSENDL